MRSGEHRSPRFARWGERLWRRPLAWGAAALVALVALALPVLGLDTGMPSIKVVPAGDHSRQGYDQVQAAFGDGAPGALQVVGPQAEATRAAAIAASATRASRACSLRSAARGGLALVQAIPAQDPSSEAVGRTVDRLRAQPAGGFLVGGAAAENHDLEQALASKTALVIGIVLALGFLLLLVALQAPVIAAVGVLTNLLATGGGVRGREADLPGRQPPGPARLRVAGLPRRLGAGVLLRDDLRDLDGLHGVPAELRQGALGPLARPARGDGRRASRTRAG